MDESRPGENTGPSDQQDPGITSTLLDSRTINFSIIYGWFAVGLHQMGCQ